MYTWSPRSPKLDGTLVPRVPYGDCAYARLVQRESGVPWVHGERRHVHLVLGLEGVVARGDVVQRQRTERTAECEQRQWSRVALETLTLQQPDLPADLQRLQPAHNTGPLTHPFIIHSFIRCKKTHGESVASAKKAK